MGPQLVGPNDEGPAVRQLGMGRLELEALAAHRRPVLAPVELERLAGLEGERHEQPTPDGPLHRLPSRLPAPDEGSDPSVGSTINEGHQVRVNPPHGPAPLASLARLNPQPFRELVGERVQAARTLGNPEPPLHGVRPQVLADRVPRQARPPLDLADRYAIPVMPPADHAQQLHVDHSDNPDHPVEEVNRHGSFLSENFEPSRVRSQCKSTLRSPCRPARPRAKPACACANVPRTPCWWPT